MNPAEYNFIVGVIPNKDWWAPSANPTFSLLADLKKEAYLCQKLLNFTNFWLFLTYMYKWVFFPNIRAKIICGDQDFRKIQAILVRKK